jgi:hypothetical protein
MYQQVDGTNDIIKDVNSRKETVMYYKGNEKHKLSTKTEFYSVKSDEFLKLHGYQLSLNMFMNPHTNVERLLVKWEPGMGKTYGAISIALRFIEQFKLESISGTKTSRNIFIIGFSEHIFKEQLLKYPELGFITKEEMEQFNKTKFLVRDGHLEEKKKLAEMRTMFNKRFHSRIGNGFFHFIGYKALVNSIFTGIDDTISDINHLNKLIEDGKVIVNKLALNMFKDSLIICDEIHNTYNSLEKNNWGATIQYLINNVSCRVVFMSATPINNNPSESIDLLNLLTPHANFNKSDFFDKDGVLKKGAKDKIRELCKGKISYLRDINPKRFPRRFILGDKLPNTPYLRFIRCKMSKEHSSCYSKIIDQLYYHEAQYICDMYIPSPVEKDKCLYQPKQIKTQLSNPPKAWYNKYKIKYVDGKISGDGLSLNENLAIISTKHYRYMQDIMSNIKEKRGKNFTFHPIVRMSGITFTQEVLIANGIIGEYDTPSNDTLCVHCGEAKKYHKTTTGGSPQSIWAKDIDYLADITCIDNDKFDDVLIARSGTIDVKDFTNERLNELTNLPECTGKDLYVEIRNWNYSEDLDETEKTGESNKIVDETDENPNVEVNEEKKQSEKTNGDEEECESDIRCSKLIENGFECVECVNPAYNLYVKRCKYIAKKDGVGKQVLNEESHNKETKDVQKDNEETKNDNDDIIQNKDDIILGGRAHKCNNYEPVRFVILHGEIDNTTLHNSMEKYNSYNNRYGHKYLIALGSKKVKEGYNFNCVREIDILGRPDNISALKQIFGRGNRSGSHIFLESNEQSIVYRIYTSYTHDGKLSYEEQKYMSKVQDYLIIQEIEKVFHEVAFDANISYNIVHSHYDDNRDIKPPKGASEMGQFDVLDHKPMIDQKTFERNITNISNIKSDTFLAYNGEKELNTQIFYIKKLFLEVSPIWKYEDLWKQMQNLPFDMEINSKLFDKKIFNLALYKLLWYKQNNAQLCQDVDGYGNVHSDKKSEPMMIDIVNEKNNGNKHMNGNNNGDHVEEKRIGDGDRARFQFQSLIDPSEKFIFGCGIKVIDYIHPYFMLLSLDEYIPNAPSNLMAKQRILQPKYNMEVMYRDPICKVGSNMSIDISNFLEKFSILYDYDEKKEKFRQRWERVPLENLEASICDFGVDFHIKFIEECIEYVFNIWTNNLFKKHYMHTFYFKMLYYYNIRNLIVWAHTVKDILFSKYKRFVVPVSVKLINKKNVDQFKHKIKDVVATEEQVTSSGLINMLKSSINTTLLHWAPSELREQYESVLDKTYVYYPKGRDMPLGKKKKVPANELPVGHLLDKVPRFYSQEDNWFDSIEYMAVDKTMKENPIIIGFDEKSKTGISVKFKIRPPNIGKKVSSDSRTIEKGSVCSFSKDKKYLLDLMKKLKIKEADSNISTICEKIRTKLIYNELTERLKKTKIKWFYFSYEKQL